MNLFVSVKTSLDYSSRKEIRWENERKPATGRINIQSGKYIRKRQLTSRKMLKRSEALLKGGFHSSG